MDVGHILLESLWSHKRTGYCILLHRGLALIPTLKASVCAMCADLIPLASCMNGLGKMLLPSWLILDCEFAIMKCCQREYCMEDPTDRLRSLRKMLRVRSSKGYKLSKETDKWFRKADKALERAYMMEWYIHIFSGVG